MKKVFVLAVLLLSLFSFTACNPVYALKSYDSEFVLHDEYRVELLTVTEETSAPLFKNQNDFTATEVVAPQNYHFIKVAIMLKRVMVASPAAPHSLNETDFKLKNYTGMNAPFDGFAKNASKDYEWYGFQLTPNNERLIHLYFLINSGKTLTSSYFVLEADFYKTYNTPQLSSAINIPLNHQV